MSHIRLRRAAVGLPLAAALLATTAAGAGAAPPAPKPSSAVDVARAKKLVKKLRGSRVEFREYMLEMHGKQDIGWTWRTDTFPDPERGWIDAAGEQIVRWHHSGGPATLRAMYHRGALPPGVKRRFTLMGIEDPGRFRATVSRKAVVEFLGRKPVCEGSDVAADPRCRAVPQPVEVPQDCPTKHVPLKLEALHDPRARKNLLIKATLPPTLTYQRCAPDSSLAAYGSVQHPLGLSLALGLEDLQRLEVDEDRELFARHAIGCPIDPPQPGRFTRCTETEVTVTATRLK